MLGFRPAPRSPWRQLVLRDSEVPGRHTPKHSDEGRALESREHFRHLIGRARSGGERGVRRGERTQVVVDERRGVLEDRFDRRGAVLADERIGVVPLGEKRGFGEDADLGEHREGACRRGDAGTVAVEEHEELVGEALEQADLIAGERRAERCDDVANLRLGEGDHVDVALDEHNPPPFVDRVPGRSQAEHRAPLLEERRLRGIEILRLSLDRGE